MNLRFDYYPLHMPGFADRLSAMKAKQEVGDVKKSSEKGASETKAKREGLTQERASVMAAFEQTQVTATEAQEAVSQAEAFASEQGENLDPDAKAEIDAIRSEASETMQRFEALKDELARIDIELSALGTPETTTQDAAQEAAIDFSDLNMEQATALLNEKIGPMFATFEAANSILDSSERDPKKVDATSAKLDSSLKELERIQISFLEKLRRDRPENATQLSEQINAARGQLEERSDQVHSKLQRPTSLSMDDLQTFSQRRALTDEVEFQKKPEGQDKEHDELIGAATFLNGRFDRGVHIDPEVITSLEERLKNLPGNVYSDLDRISNPLQRIKQARPAG